MLLEMDQKMRSHLMERGKHNLLMKSQAPSSEEWDESATLDAGIVTWHLDTNYDEPHVYILQLLGF